MPVLFLTLDEALAIHAHQISRYGGALGIRDRGLLESALAMPAASFAGELLHPSLAEQAAAYLFHLVKNHPFIDGNKRVGLACSLCASPKSHPCCSRGLAPLVTVVKAADSRDRSHPRVAR